MAEIQSGSGCFLTTACMQHYLTNFDDNCHELIVLRWFRDNYVSPEDKVHYYQTAPQIVKAIDSELKKELIYNYIYDNIIDLCVNAIKEGNYMEAYKAYKEGINRLEATFIGPTLKLLKAGNRF